jgi:hypothetical protein
VDKLSQTSKKDIWLSMRENRLRREKRDRYVLPILVLAGLIFLPVAVVYTNSAMFCLLIQKIQADDVVMSCALRNTESFLHAGQELIRLVQTHSGEIIGWGIMALLLCVGVGLLLSLLKIIFS